MTRDTVIVPLWVDGNYMAWRRKRLGWSRAALGNGNTQNRLVIDRQEIESEFRRTGLTIVAYQDFAPGYAMWRVYTLRKPI